MTTPGFFFAVSKDYRHPNLGLAKEGPELVANADITQRRTAGYLMDQVTIGPKWTLMASLRYDNITTVQDSAGLAVLDG
jgi:outer membrane receptor for monomeric catechols